MINSLYDNFQHWSEGGSVYIISDTHFDDEDCKLMDPSWPTAQEQIDILKRIMNLANSRCKVWGQGQTKALRRY